MHLRLLKVIQNVFGHFGKLKGFEQLAVSLRGISRQALTKRVRSEPLRSRQVATHMTSRALPATSFEIPYCRAHSTAWDEPERCAFNLAWSVSWRCVLKLMEACCLAHLYRNTISPAVLCGLLLLYTLAICIFATPGRSSSNTSLQMEQRDGNLLAISVSSHKAVAFLLTENV